MSSSEDHLSVFCPHYQRAVELIGSRWTGAVLRALSCDLYRFSDLKDAIPGLSDRMLSERLKELEAETIVSRTVIPDKGRALGDVMGAIALWAETWIGETPPPADSTAPAETGAASR